MITVIIILGFAELMATYMIFYHCSKNTSYEDHILKLKKEQSEEDMFRLFGYIDKVKDLHTMAFDEQDSIIEINKILESYLGLISKIQDESVKKYIKYHTDIENEKMYQILNAEHLSVVIPCIQFIKAKHMNEVL